MLLQAVLMVGAALCGLVAAFAGVLFVSSNAALQELPDSLSGTWGSGSLCTPTCAHSFCR